MPAASPGRGSKRDRFEREGNLPSTERASGPDPHGNKKTPPTPLGKKEPAPPPWKKNEHPAQTPMGLPMGEADWQLHPLLPAPADPHELARG